jgi:hypothetical protein
LEERRVQWVNRLERVQYSAEQYVQQVRAREMSITEVRDELTDIEEAYKFEQMMGNVFEYGHELDLDWELDFAQSREEEDIPLAVTMRLWEQGELELTREDDERPS